MLCFNICRKQYCLALQTPKVLLEFTLGTASLAQSLRHEENASCDSRIFAPLSSRLISHGPATPVCSKTGWTWDWGSSPLLLPLLFPFWLLTKPAGNCGVPAAGQMLDFRTAFASLISPNRFHETGLTQLGCDRPLFHALHNNGQDSYSLCLCLQGLRREGS